MDPKSALLTNLSKVDTPAFYDYKGIQRLKLVWSIIIIFKVLRSVLQNYCAGSQKSLKIIIMYKIFAHYYNTLFRTKFFKESKFLEISVKIFNF